MLITLLGDVLISPFVFFRFIYIEWFGIGSWWIVEITELVSIVIVSADFSDTQIFGLGESFDIGLISFFVEEIKWSSAEFVSFKVQNKNSSWMFFCSFRAQVPFGSGFNHNELPVINHACGIHGDWENVFEEYFSSAINMNNTISSKFLHTHEYESIIVGWVQVHDFPVRAGELYFSLFCKEHLY